MAIVIWLLIGVFVPTFCWVVLQLKNMRNELSNHRQMIQQIRRECNRGGVER